jgi:hypothetical protein
MGGGLDVLIMTTYFYQTPPTQCSWIKSNNFWRISHVKCYELQHVM